MQYSDLGLCSVDFRKNNFAKNRHFSGLWPRPFSLVSGGYSDPQSLGGPIKICRSEVLPGKIGFPYACPCARKASFLLAPEFPTKMATFPEKIFFSSISPKVVAKCRYKLNPKSSIPGAHPREKFFLALMPGQMVLTRGRPPRRPLGPGPTKIFWSTQNSRPGSALNQKPRTRVHTLEPYTSPRFFTKSEHSLRHSLRH